MKYLFLLFIIVLQYNVYSQTVYKTPYGKKYHLSNCKMVENVSAELTISEALNLGLTPCKICKPPLVNSNIYLTPNKPKGKGKTVQCKGITKKGTQCKHMTSIANGYCFQHNPDK